MGNQQPKLLAGLPVVIIVGGGYGGVTVAKALDASGKCNVLVIERKEYFLHNIASLRAAVERGFEKQIMFPYTNLLKHGSVIHAQVTQIEPQVIHLHGYEQPIRFDYLVVATGSTYPFPGKVEEFSYQGAIEEYKLLQHHVKQASNIAIIGGGPVGVELAGEIATELPDKKITLIHSHDQLMDDGLRSEFRDQVKIQLERLHVNVVLGQRVDVTQLEQKSDGMRSSYIAGPHQLITDQGTTLHPDLTFIATGTRTNTHTWKNTLPLAADGRIKVNSFLQVDGHSRIYAIGDSASIGRKMAYYAGLHGVHAANNILSAINNKPQKPYAGDGYPVAFVSIGQNGGAGQFPNKKGTIVKSTMAKMIKSKTLRVDQEWAKMNLKPSSAPSSPRDHTTDIPISRARNVSAAFHLPETDQWKQAQQLLKQGLPVDSALQV